MSRKGNQSNQRSDRPILINDNPAGESRSTCEQNPHVWNNAHRVTGKKRHNTPSVLLDTFREEAPQTQHILEDHKGPTIMTQGFEAHEGPAVISEEHEGNILCTHTLLSLLGRGPVFSWKYIACLDVYVWALSSSAMLSTVARGSMHVMWHAELSDVRWRC